MIAKYSLLLGLCALLACGCGGGEDLGDPVAVSGKVTLNGQPLSDALVSFTALSGLPAEYRSARTTTDSEGRYQFDSLYPAEYQVSIVKDDPSAPQDAAVPAPAPLAQYGPDSPLRAKIEEEKSDLNFDL